VREIGKVSDGVSPAEMEPPKSSQKSIVFQDLCICIISNDLSFVHGTPKT
jgi:hypothetical protein